MIATLSNHRLGKNSFQFWWRSKKSKIKLSLACFLVCFIKVLNGRGDEKKQENLWTEVRWVETGKREREKRKKENSMRRRIERCCFLFFLLLPIENGRSYKRRILVLIVSCHCQFGALGAGKMEHVVTPRTQTHFLSFAFRKKEEKSFFSDDRQLSFSHDVCLPICSKRVLMASKASRKSGGKNYEQFYYDAELLRILSSSSLSHSLSFFLSPSVLSLFPPSHSLISSPLLLLFLPISLLFFLFSLSFSSTNQSMFVKKLAKIIIRNSAIEQTQPAKNHPSFLFEWTFDCILTLYFAACCRKRKKDTEKRKKKEREREKREREKRKKDRK